MYVQDTVGTKADVDGGKMNILGFVLGCGSSIQRVDLHEHFFVGLLYDIA